MIYAIEQFAPIFFKSHELFCIPVPTIFLSSQIHKKNLYAPKIFEIFLLFLIFVSLTPQFFEGSSGFPLPAARQSLPLSTSFLSTTAAQPPLGEPNRVPSLAHTLEWSYFLFTLLSPRSLTLLTQESPRKFATKTSETRYSLQPTCRLLGPPARRLTALEMDQVRILTFRRPVLEIISLSLFSSQKTYKDTHNTVSRSISCLKFFDRFTSDSGANNLSCEVLMH